MIKTTRKKADIDKKPELNEINCLYRLRRACMKNAIDLLKESEILYKHRKYPRSFALSYTAFEEVSKHQIVSDYISGIISKKEMESAFKQHYLKAAYGKIKVVVGPTTPFNKTILTNDSTLFYDLDSGREIFSFRNNVLYVNHAHDFEPIEPKNICKAIDAKRLIGVVKKRIATIIWAEKFNGRIGTLALVK